MSILANNKGVFRKKCQRCGKFPYQFKVDMVNRVDVCPLCNGAMDGRDKHVCISCSKYSCVNGAHICSRKEPVKEVNYVTGESRIKNTVSDCSRNSNGLCSEWEEADVETR